MKTWILIAGQWIAKLLVAWFASSTFFALIRCPRFWVNVLFPLLALFGVVRCGFLSLAGLAAINLALLVASARSVRAAVVEAMRLGAVGGGLEPGAADDADIDEITARALRAIVLACGLAIANQAAAQSPQPQWVEVPATRPVDRSLGVVLSDIASRCDRRGIDHDHPSSLWPHEGIHFINASVRNGHAGMNAAYILDGFAARIREPKTTLRAAIARVPAGYRGESAIGTLFDSQALAAWDSQPLYAADEWSAYLAGAAWGIEMGHPDRVTSTARAIDCGVVATCAAWASASDDEELRRFLRFMWERTFWAARECEGEETVVTRVRRLRRDTSADEWRKWMQGYFGPDWCFAVLGVE